MSLQKMPKIQKLLEFKRLSKQPKQLKRLPKPAKTPKHQPKENEFFLTNANYAFNAN